jgi:HEAT repeats
VRSYPFLLHVITAEAAILAVVIVLLIGYAAVHGWYTRWSAARLTRARAVLSAILDRSVEYEAGLAELRRLPASLKIRLLVEFARALQNEERLGDIARALGLVLRAEALCRSRWWWRRLHGLRLLTQFGDGASLVPALLRDAAPVVRAQAVEWVGRHSLAGFVDHILQRLDDPVGLVRFAAQDALLRGGDVVIEPLRGYLGQAPDRGTGPALQVAIGLADPRFLETGLALGQSGSMSTRALAASLAGAIGGRESIASLMAWLADPAPEVRAAAAAALGRMGHWPAAPAIARLLGDRAWAVRREAGLALAALGAPGALFLRRALADPDRFAADMSRRVLDIAEVASLGSDQ